jgi:hypothetical protein
LSAQAQRLRQMATPDAARMLVEECESTAERNTPVGTAVKRNPFSTNTSYIVLAFILISPIFNLSH